jgi:hypothetical protein
MHVPVIVGNCAGCAGCILSNYLQFDWIDRTAMVISPKFSAAPSRGILGFSRKGSNTFVESEFSCHTSNFVASQSVPGHDGMGVTGSPGVTH